MYIADFAETAPERAAVVMGESGRRISYRELNEGSIRCARLLHECGLRRGDHFAVLLENHPAYFEIVWAGMRAGLYITAVNAHLTAAEAGYIVDDCEAKVLVTSAALAPLADEMVALTPGVTHRFMVDGTTEHHRSYEEATAAQEATLLDEQSRGMVMLYSSGTTGRPKGIKFPLPAADSPLGEWEIAEHSRARFGFGEEMVFLCPAPLYHAAPLRVAMAVHSIGGTVVVMERFDPAFALSLIERERVTHSQWVPTMFVRMLKLPEAERTRYDLSSHRMASHAAAPCAVHVKEQMIEWWGPIIEEYYSGTENFGSTSITSAEWLAHKGSVGRTAGVAVIHICDDDGHELPVGETGAVYFEDPSAAFEYHGDPTKTSSAQHPAHPTWRTLGDIGRVDDEDYLYLTDRRAFMIVAGGVNIYPQEIEDVLLAHPDVLDVAVFGVPNADLGEEVKAVVQPVAGAVAGEALAADLQAWCEGRLARYKWPRSIDFEARLPRLDNGKLYKTGLRDRYWEGRESRVV
jgi:long-chain acyl-CoA synthetase